MTISLDATLGIHAHALALRASRAEVLASNLTNADTPHYKARDFDFKSVLAKVNTGANLTLNASHAAHIRRGANTSSGQVAAKLLYRVPLMPSFDGNTVDTHVEQSMFAQNAIHYQMSARLLGSKVRGMLLALRGE